MSDPRIDQQETTSGPGAPSTLFAPSPARAPGLPPAAWGAAGLIALVLIGALFFASRRHSSPSAYTALPLDPYAANLVMSGPAMSESTSLSGGKSTFIDGHIRNTGSRTVTGATVQVFFRNDEGMPPHIETLPLSLIRTRDPYVDTEPVSAAPLKSGDEQEFRLIFENVPGNWNTQMPEIHVVHVAAR